MLKRNLIRHCFLIACLATVGALGRVKTVHAVNNAVNAQKAVRNETRGGAGVSAALSVYIEQALKDIETETQEESGDAVTLESLGYFTVTAYCDCEKCVGRWAGLMTTATGTTPIQGHTIAADTDVLPFGTIVYIDGVPYTVEDCGGAVKGRKIDIYFDSHADAVAFGKQQKEIFIKGE